MTGVELALCLSAVVSSSVSQLFIKGASVGRRRMHAIGRLGVACMLMGCSVILVVLALRSMPLSQLVPFAAGAYVLVPLGSRIVFGDRLTRRFWLGVFLIIGGIIGIHI